MIKHITKDNFTEVMQSNELVLVDFGATWCGPCRMITPELEALSEEYPNLYVGKVDIDEEEELTTQFNIMTVPTIMLFRNGKLEKSFVGYKSKEEIKKAVL